MSLIDRLSILIIEFCRLEKASVIEPNPQPNTITPTKSYSQALHAS